MDEHCICLRRNLSQSLLRENAESLSYKVRWVTSRQLLRKLLLRKPLRTKLAHSHRVMSSLNTRNLIRKWKMKEILYSELSLKLYINLKIVEHMLNAIVYFLNFYLSYSFGYQFIKRSLSSLHHVLQSPLLDLVFKHCEDKFNRVIHRRVWWWKYGIYVKVIIEL